MTNFFNCFCIGPAIEFESYDSRDDADNRHENIDAKSCQDKLKVQLVTKCHRLIEEKRDDPTPDNP